MAKLYTLLLLMVLASTVGCVDNKPYMTEELRKKGLVMILPGIEGVSNYNRNIRKGLVKGGIDRAIMIRRWGHFLLSQMDFIGNRLEGARIAREIIEYQNRFPGRSVWVIGHSGGGGVAVFAAEALPDGRKLDGLILLSASLHEDYDLKKALSHCRHGIVNFYNPSDTALLAVGTTLVGNVDGRRGPSAGLKGFSKVQFDNIGEATLTQVQVNGGTDPHGRATEVDYVASKVIPFVLR